MNISSTSAGSGAGWFASAIRTTPAANFAGTGFEESYVGESLMGSGPQSSKNLTKADRETIKATTGIDIRDNGEIGSPASMSLLDYGNALGSIGQLAASRSRGQTADLAGSDFLQALAARGYSNSARLDLHDYEGIDFRA